MTRFLTPPFRVRLWCRDCTGDDPMGCFDGGAEMVTSDESPNAALEFTTLRSAVVEGYARTRACARWAFDVIDANDRLVEYGNATTADLGEVKGAKC